MIGNRDLATLTDIIELVMAERGISGDETQKKPLESGVPFSLTLTRKRSGCSHYERNCSSDP
nr:hypothetical protein [Klebsiella pneumoniae]